MSLWEYIVTFVIYLAGLSTRYSHVYLTLITYYTPFLSNPDLTRGGQ